MAQRFRPRGRRSGLSPSSTSCALPRRYALALLAVLGALALPGSASAQAEQSYFFEETAEANWSVAHQCADGSIVQARLLVRSTYDFESPDTFSWARPAGPVSHTSTANLKSVSVSGAFTARDNSGMSHEVTIDVSWTGFGPLETSVNPSQGSRIGTSTRKQRAATATGTVTFDGGVLVSGEANHPFITPFIRTDEERFTDTP
jgi:hypothetical protein